MANQNDTVVGVFLDDAAAQQAVQALQSAGFNARIADNSAVQAFRNVGMEEEVANMYQNRMQEGHSIVTVDAGGRGDDALGVMLQNGAEYIDLAGTGQGGNMGAAGAGNTNDADMRRQQAAQYRNMPVDQRQYGMVDETTGSRKNADQTRVQLRDETLTPVKQSAEAGQVELHKVVHEKEQEVPVTLRREEVYIERTPVDRPVQAGEITDMKDETIRVPVYQEQAELQKQTRVREEVGIEKRAVEEQTTLTGTARHEHVEVTPTEGVQVQGNAGDNITTQSTQTTTDTTHSDSAHSGMAPYDTTDTTRNTNR